MKKRKIALLIISIVLATLILIYVYPFVIFRIRLNRLAENYDISIEKVDISSSMNVFNVYHVYIYSDNYYLLDKSSQLKFLKDTEAEYYNRLMPILFTKGIYSNGEFVTINSFNETEKIEHKIRTDYSNELRPIVGMSERYINDTKLGKATYIKKSLDFDVKVPRARYKEYMWGTEKNWSFKATVSYRKYYGNKYNQYVDLEDGQGYVSSICYYDKDGKFISIDYTIDDYYN